MVEATDVPRRFADFGRWVLDERERDGGRGVDRERQRFKVHLATAPFAEKTITEITSTDIADWLEGMATKPALDQKGKATERRLSPSTVQNCFFQCSRIFDAAGPQGLRLIQTNPCKGLRAKWAEGIPLKRTRGVPSSTPFLTLAEQKAIETCEAISDADRWTILFAIRTGLTPGEMFHLRLDDLHVGDPDPYVQVRFGSEGHALERPRRVPLEGLALEAARRWLDLLPSYARRNPKRLAFPDRSGAERPKGRPLGRARQVAGRRADPFQEAMRALGITRAIRWYDLRHTCGASLFLGAWGRAHTLDEIRDFLGLSTILLAERYTKLSDPTIPFDGATVTARDRPRPRDVAPNGASTAQREDRGAPAVRDAPSRWNADRVDLRTEDIERVSSELSLPTEVLARSAAALSSGKHVLLVGPPGTGKTELAHALVDAAANAAYCAGAHVATASPDWSTFETIGGYAIERDGSLRFRAGALLRALERYQWLIVDEFNRADVDRAFGALMTVLSGRTIDTVYELDGGTTVRIGPDAAASHPLPRTFRVIATMNTWDKTSLFRLSYAVQRRFAIIDVNVPPDAAYGALLRRHATSELASEPLLDAETVDALARLFSTEGLLPTRHVGPAVAIDLVRYARRRASDGVGHGDAVAEGINLFVLPQLEGLPQDRAVDALRAIKTTLRGVASAGALCEFEERFHDLFPHLRRRLDDG